MTTVLDLISIDQEGRVFLRYRDTDKQGQRVVYDNFRREVIEPGDDLSGFPGNVQAICAIEHTPARVAAAMARRRSHHSPRTSRRAQAR
jgi:hypothetical protein